MFWWGLVRERSRFPFSVSWVGWSIGVYLKYISSISSLVRPPVFLFLFLVPMIWVKTGIFSGKVCCAGDSVPFDCVRMTRFVGRSIIGANGN